MASSFLFESPFIKLHNERKMWEKWGGAVVNYHSFNGNYSNYRYV